MSESLFADGLCLPSGSSLTRPRAGEGDGCADVDSGRVGCNRTRCSPCVEWRMSGRDFIMRYRTALSLVLQLMLIVASNAVAFICGSTDTRRIGRCEAFWQMLPWLVAIRAVTFIPFRLYEGLWRYTSIYDLQALIGGVIDELGRLLCLSHRHPSAPPRYPRSIFVIDAVAADAAPRRRPADAPALRRVRAPADAASAC